MAERPQTAVARPRIRPAGLPFWVTVPIAILALAAAATQSHGQDNLNVSHGISTFDELKYPADMAHLGYVNPNAPKGGEISIWAFGSYDSMNPYSTKGRAERLASAAYESILSGTADEIGASYCLMCTTMEYPDDRSFVIFNLREDVTFSDGSPLTAEDIVFSYETFREKGLPSFRAQLTRQVETAEVLGPYRVKYTFKEGVPTRDLPELVGGLPVFSKADYVANDRNLEDSSMDPLIGSGAYVAADLDVGQSSVYRRNPDYWGNDHPLNIGRNNFDAIRLEYYADYNAAFEGFKGGSYTFRNEASSKIWATGYDFPAIEAGHVKKVELPSGAKATGQAFLFNMRREKFQDRRVREAIGLMFNFEWSNETLFYGLYDRVNSFWDNHYLAAEGLPSDDELELLRPLADRLPPGVLDQEAKVWPVSGNRQLDRANLRRAGQLLDEAGWLVGDDGLRRKDGRVLSVEFLNDSQTFDRVINPYVENLKRLGVEAVHNRIDNAQMEARERPPEYDFDIVTGFASTSYIPGSELYQYYGSESADNSVFNKMGLKSQAVDELIAVVNAAESNDELTVAVRALDRVLRAEVFWVPQWNKNVHTVAYYDMYEHPEELPPYSLGNLDFWWYNAERAAELEAAGAL